jgi:hypothetical protein
MGSILLAQFLFLFKCGIAIHAVTQTYLQHYRHSGRLQYRRQVGEMFYNYNLIAAIAAFTPCTAKHTSRKFASTALVCGGLGLISIFYLSKS